MRVSYEDLIDIICDADFETKLRGQTSMTKSPRNLVSVADMERWGKEVEEKHG